MELVQREAKDYIPPQPLPPVEPSNVGVDVEAPATPQPVDAVHEAPTAAPATMPASGAHPSTSYMSLHVITHLDLELDVGTPLVDGCGNFRVVGPSRRLKALPQAARAVLHGLYSPTQLVTLPHSVRAAAGVPADAHSFAFAHPVAAHGASNWVTRADQAWIFFLLLGGFLYFNSEGKLIQVNALSLMPPASSSVAAQLHIYGPYTLVPGVIDALDAHHRILPVTLEALSSAAFARFGWANPREKPGGMQLGEHPYEHGAFVYEMAGGEQVYYVLTDKLRDGGAPDADAPAASGGASEPVGAGGAVCGGAESPGDGRASVAMGALGGRTLQHALASLAEERRKAEKQMAFIRRNFGDREGVASSSRFEWMKAVGSVQLRLWPVVLTFGFTLALSALSYVRRGVFEVVATFVWFGLLSYTAWKPLEDLSLMLPRWRQTYLRYVLLATPLLATLIFLVLRYSLPTVSSLFVAGAVARSVAFVLVGLGLPLLAFVFRRATAIEERAEMHAKYQKSLGQLPVTPTLSDLSDVSAPPDEATMPPLRAGAAPSPLAKGEGGPPPLADLAAADHELALTGATHVQQATRRWLTRSHYLTNVMRRRQRLLYFSKPIFAAAVVDVLGNLAVDLYGSTELKANAWIALLTPGLIVILVDLNREHVPRYSVAHAIFFIACLYQARSSHLLPPSPTFSHLLPPSPTFSHLLPPS
jgi:hypothetical protein